LCNFAIFSYLKQNTGFGDWICAYSQEKWWEGSFLVGSSDWEAVPVSETLCSVLKKEMMVKAQTPSNRDCILDVFVTLF
jgi:hypothetical protein